MMNSRLVRATTTALASAMMLTALAVFFAAPAQAQEATPTEATQANDNEPITVGAPATTTATEAPAPAPGDNAAPAVGTGTQVGGFANSNDSVIPQVVAESPVQAGPAAADEDLPITGPATELFLPAAAALGLMGFALRRRAPQTI